MTSATETRSHARSGPRSGFGSYAWAVLLYLLFVIAFGAWVRITGSGAGCGDHWPLCRGEVVPRAPELQTVIEFSHRVTSGVLGPLCLVLVAWTFLGAGKRRVLQRLSLGVTFFVVVEALIGAGLVKGGLVADDTSLARAVVIALHLGNTLLLTGAAALLAWAGSGYPIRRPQRGVDVLFLGLVMLVSMTGAVTALGDTLFPVAPASDGGLLARVTDGLDGGTHFLVRLRVVHPLLATGVACWLLWRSGERMRRLPRHGTEARLQRWLHGLVWAELVVGVANVMLSAPGWIQLVHLTLAQGVWIVLVLCAANADQAAARTVPG